MGQVLATPLKYPTISLGGETICLNSAVVPIVLGTLPISLPIADILYKKIMFKDIIPLVEGTNVNALAGLVEEEQFEIQDEETFIATLRLIALNEFFEETALLEMDQYLINVLTSSYIVDRLTSRFTNHQCPNVYEDVLLNVDFSLGEGQGVLPMYVKGFYVNEMGVAPQFDIRVDLNKVRRQFETIRDYLDNNLEQVMDELNFGELSDARLFSILKIINNPKFRQLGKLVLERSVVN